MDMPDGSAGTPRPVGALLRDWRQRRRLTQLDLSCATDIPIRLLCALEKGRALPNRDLVLRLADQLEVPLRDCNALLIAAGCAPAFPVRPLDDPAMADTRATIELVLAGHEPNPGLAIDRHWVIVASNEVFWDMVAGVDPALLCPPVNWLRLALHPAGLAPRIANLRHWRAHMLTRLRRRFEATGDPELADLVEEIGDYPMPPALIDGDAEHAAGHAAVPLRLMTVDGPLSFHGTTTVFGSAVDVTLAELTVEMFFPADPATATVMRRTAQGSAVGTTLATANAARPAAAG